MENLEKIIEFLHEIGNLKKTMRFGANDLIKGDSSADHSWRLALMTFVMAEELNLEIDVLRAMKIALIHDLAEAITGDIDIRIIAAKKMTKEQKEKMEMEAFENLRKSLPYDLGKEVYELWKEYENGSSSEGKYIKALDKLETQLKIIEEGYKVYDSPELIANYPNKAVENFPELTPVLKIIKEKLKEEFKKGDFEWKPEYDMQIK